MTVPSITLNNGVSIPQVGLGVFQVPDDETQANVEKALELGYRHVDTAAGYYNEAGVGAALRASGLPREDLFVTTKLRNGDQGFDQALTAFENSRRELGLDYVDLYLIHWPVPSKDLYVETWKAFEKLLEEGVVKAIGVSNFLPEHLDRLVRETDVVPAVNQVEVHPWFGNEEVRAFDREHGIVTEAWSPLGRGRVLDEPTLARIADAHGRTPAQVALRWHVQRGDVVFPKSATPSRIEENARIFDFALDADEMGAITALDRGERTGSHPDEENRTDR